MYLLVLAILFTFHVCLSVGYSPVHKLPEFGDIYYTTEDLKIRLAESWKEYGKQILIYNRLNNSIFKLYEESQKAQDECTAKLTRLKNNINNYNFVRDLVNQESKILNDSVLLYNRINITGFDVQELKSAVETEEVVSNVLKSKLEELKVKSLLQERKLSDDKLALGNLDIENTTNYDKLTSDFLNLLEYNNYLAHEIINLEKTENQMKLMFYRNKIQCDKNFATLLMEVKQFKEVEGSLAVNVDLLNEFIIKLKGRSTIEVISLIEKLKELKTLNDDLKTKIAVITKNNLLSKTV